MSDKLLLHARRRSSSGAVARNKNGDERAMGGRERRGREGVVSLPPPRHYVTSARCFARRCGGSAGERVAHASGEGSRAVEKVDQYQAKRSAPTNLCGDPSNDTSRSLQPNRFREHDVENRDTLLPV